MPFSRPGAAEAAKLWAEDDAAVWQAEASKYEACVKKVAAAGSRTKNLVANDKWLQSELAPAVLARKPMHMTLPELERVMEWKLARGKWRPLQKMVAGNPPDKVIASSTEAFKAVPNVKKAVTALSALRGIGPATASAVLAITHPEHFAFMADESFEAVEALGARVYTMAAYEAFNAAMVERAKELGPPWTAARVSQALWCRAMDAAHAGEAANPNKRKR